MNKAVRIVARFTVLYEQGCIAGPHEGASFAAAVNVTDRTSIQ
jgi:hypothetical protein